MRLSTGQTQAFTMHFCGEMGSHSFEKRGRGFNQQRTHRSKRGLEMADHSIQLAASVVWKILPNLTTSWIIIIKCASCCKNHPCNVQSIRYNHSMESVILWWIIKKIRCSSFSWSSHEIVYWTNTSIHNALLWRNGVTFLWKEGAGL